jgi:hypothetical protein
MVRLKIEHMPKAELKDLVYNLINDANKVFKLHKEVTKESSLSATNSDSHDK